MPAKPAPMRFHHIVFRGDDAAYEQRGGRFPYVDHAAKAGATGVHIWFWKEPFLALKDRFLLYCRERKIGVHLGIGVGAYDVCNKENPLDPVVQRKIKDHVARTIEACDPAGIEFQTGEYDRVEYRGDAVQGLSRAQQAAAHLNPIIDYVLRLKPSLWVRAELNAEFFPEAEIQAVAREMDPRCTVEWSRFTAPYRGPDALDRGRRLLEAGRNFSWFLKVVSMVNVQRWKELAADDSPGQMAHWLDYWRDWVRLLHEHKRPTLTVCLITGAYVDEAFTLPTAAVALARNPDIANEEALGLLKPPVVPSR